MRRARIVLLFAAWLATWSVSAQEPAGRRVAGTITDGDGQWVPGDVWVAGDAFEIQAWITETPLDAAAILQDGVVDDSDFAAARAAGTRMVWLGLDADGNYSTGALVSDRNGKFVRAMKGSDVERVLSSRIENGRMVAALELPDTSLRFDTLILGNGPDSHLVKRDSDAYPALAEQLRAAADPENGAWLDTLHPDLQQRWQDIYAARNLHKDDLIRDGRALLPRELGALRGMRNPNAGVIELEGTDERGRHWSGRLTQHAGRWRVRLLFLQPTPPPQNPSYLLIHSTSQSNEWRVHHLAEGIERGTVVLAGVFVLLLVIAAMPMIPRARKKR